MSRRFFILPLVITGFGVAAIGGHLAIVEQRAVSGKGIVASEDSQNVASLPTSLTEVPGGRWAVIASTGRRQQLTTVDRRSGKVASTLPFERKEAIYGPMTADRNGNLFVARGYQDSLAVYAIDEGGKLSETGRIPVIAKPAPEGWPRFAAGVAIDRSAKWAYVPLNATSAYTDFKGSVAVIDLANKKPYSIFEAKGFPMAIASEGDRLYVGSERDDCVEVFDLDDPSQPRLVKTIPVGKHPISIRTDPSLNRIYVANENSDTISMIDTRRLVVTKTLLLRPPQALDLPGATPVDVTIAQGQDRLYVPLADMNAVAAIRRSDLTLEGLIPTANYPSTATTTDEGAVLVACARGNRLRVPNKNPVGPKGAYGREVMAIQEGTLETVPIPSSSSLKLSTAQAIQANSLGAEWKARVDSEYERVRKFGVKHVIYVVKENRTYDQVFGDMKEGNGDPSLTDFPEKISPNHHALARRFALLDNFYCCADVSADGWTWSVAGMIPNYNARNTPVLYSDRGRTYDFEGQNEGTAVEFKGLNDVAKPPGGYLWDLCLAKGLTFRNYGFYISTADPDEKGPDGKYLNEAGRAAVLGLDKNTDREFGFGLEYADSDLWREYDCASSKQRLHFGAYGSTSRMTEWLREFKKYEKTNSLPNLTFLTLQRDHTAGNTPGLHTPSAMVADNDYALGQLVQIVSHSKFWKDTAIIVVEDDASNGYDHVDCHRSLCLAISPLVPRGLIEHRFGNTVTAVRTIEALLGLPAMNQYDRFSMPLSFFSASAKNDAPYDAIKPAPKIVGAVNSLSAYKANEFTVKDFTHPDAVDDDDLREIVHHDRDAR